MTTTAPTPDSWNEPRMPWERDPDFWKGDDRPTPSSDREAVEALLAEVTTTPTKEGA